MSDEENKPETAPAPEEPPPPTLEEKREQIRIGYEQIIERAHAEIELRIREAARARSYAEYVQHRLTCVPTMSETEADLILANWKAHADADDASRRIRWASSPQRWVAKAKVALDPSAGEVTWTSLEHDDEKK